MIVTLRTRRQVPSRFGGVIRDGRLIQEAVDGKKVAAANRPGSDEVLEWPRPVNRGSGVGKVVTEEPPISVAVNTIANAGKRVREFAACEALLKTAGAYAAAAEGHRR